MPHRHRRLVRIVVGDPKRKKQRMRPRKYDATKILKVLKKFWYFLDCMFGKRLAPTLKTMLLLLEKYGEIEADGNVREKLFTISSATIDCLLSHDGGN